MRQLSLDDLEPGFSTEEASSPPPILASQLPTLQTATSSLRTGLNLLPPGAKTLEELEAEFAAVSIVTPSPVVPTAPPLIIPDSPPSLQVGSPPGLAPPGGGGVGGGSLRAPSSAGSLKDERSVAATVAVATAGPFEDQGLMGAGEGVGGRARQQQVSVPNQQEMAWPQMQQQHPGQQQQQPSYGGQQQQQEGVPLQPPLQQQQQQSGGRVPGAPHGGGSGGGGGVHLLGSPGVGPSPVGQQQQQRPSGGSMSAFGPAHGSSPGLGPQQFSNMGQVMGIVQGRPPLQQQGPPQQHPGFHPPRPSPGMPPFHTLPMHVQTHLLQQQAMAHHAKGSGGGAPRPPQFVGGAPGFPPMQQQQQQQPGSPMSRSSGGGNGGVPVPMIAGGGQQFQFPRRDSGSGGVAGGGVGGMPPLLPPQPPPPPPSQFARPPMPQHGSPMLASQQQQIPPQPPGHGGRTDARPPLPPIGNFPRGELMTAYDTRRVVWVVAGFRNNVHRIAQWFVRRVYLFLIFISHSPPACYLNNVWV